MIANLIQGMPLCGQCPQCRGAMHFAYETQNGLCRFCGPGSEKDASRSLEHCATPEAGLMAMSDSTRGATAPVKAIPSPVASAGGVSRTETVATTIDPGMIAAQLQARGFAPDACPYCTLRATGMNVDVTVVPHSEACGNIESK